MLETIAYWCFWLSSTTLFYTYFGYAALIGIFGKFFPKPVKKAQLPDEELPEVTILLIACNEAPRITQRINNLLDTNYPANKLQILIVSDGSDDGMNELVRNHPDKRVRLLPLPKRQGKANGLNHGMAQITTEITVYADARQSFDPQTIPELLQNLADPNVGAVSGTLEIVPSEPGVSTGIDVYWRLEKFIRRNEGRIDSCIGCTGAIYAIRTALYTPMPQDTLIDDVYTPLKIIEKGYRVAYEPAALCIDPQPLDRTKERIRKPRTLAGNFQLLFRYPEWWLPWKSRVAMRLISHKYLRLTGPYMMITSLIANLLLLGTHEIYWITLAGQAAYYTIAIQGLLGGDILSKRHPLLSSFLFLNYTVLLGTWLYLTGKYKGAWQMASKTKS